MYYESDDDASDENGEIMISKVKQTPVIRVDKENEKDNVHDLISDNENDLD